MNSNQENSSDPRFHADKLKDMLNQVAEHARQDVGRVSDPAARALFETTAEVVTGLVTAYDHFETQKEPAWKS